MQKIKINVDYKTDIAAINKLNQQEGFPEVTKDESDAGLTLNYVRFAVEQKYEKGLEGQLRRIWGRIERKFEAAIEDKTYEVELEEAEKDFIKNTFAGREYPVKLTKYINIFEDEFIDKLSEKAAKGK